MNRRNNGFIRPTMEDFFRNAGSCKNEQSSCSRTQYTSKKLEDKDIEGTQYGFNKDGGSTLPGNYFCLVEYDSIKYPGIFINDTSNNVNVFL